MSNPEVLNRLRSCGCHPTPQRLEVAAVIMERPQHLSADQILERQELATLALQGVEGLSEKYRSVFVLRDLQGLSTEETAKVLDIEATTVRQRLHRARLMLRGYMGAIVGEST